MSKFPEGFGEHHILINVKELVLITVPFVIITIMVTISKVL